MHLFKKMVVGTTYGNNLPLSTGYLVDLGKIGPAQKHREKGDAGNEENGGTARRRFAQRGFGVPDKIQIFAFERRGRPLTGFRVRTHKRYLPAEILGHALIEAIAFLQHDEIGPLAPLA